METYTVKQISEMLQTNPETVRRWIRDKKLKSTMTSKKDGSVITDGDLKLFLKSMPKYFSYFSPKGLAINPIDNIAAIAGSIIGSAILSIRENKKNYEKTILSDDLKAYIQQNIEHLNSELQQKQELLSQTEQEIQELEIKINQRQYILEHEEILNEAAKNITITKED